MIVCAGERRFMKTDTNSTASLERSTYAADFAQQVRHMDWRDLIPRINLPTLIISGRASIIPWKSQERIHRQI